MTEEENDCLPIDLQYLPSEKKRETINDVIITLVQALHKLCSTQKGRDAMRKWNVYVILRELDKATIEVNKATKQYLDNRMFILVSKQTNTILTNQNRDEKSNV